MINGQVIPVLDRDKWPCVDGRKTLPTETTADVTERATISDKQLVVQIAQRDSDALGQLYDRHAGAVLALSHKILRNRGDAEDLVHDVFIEAWQCAKQYDEKKASVRTWLILRTRSRALDRLRRLEVARRHAMVPQPLIKSHIPSQSEQAADGATATRALAQLSADHRQVIELGYFKGLTAREISARCGIPVGTVKSRLSASMKILRKLLGRGVA